MTGQLRNVSRISAPDADDQIALISQCSELVDLLDLLYPEACPNPDDSEREVWMKAGQRELVRRLIHLRQQGNPFRR